MPGGHHPSTRECTCLPNGNLFYAGSGRGSRIFNTTNNTWSAVIATTNLGSCSPVRHVGLVAAFTRGIIALGS